MRRAILRPMASSTHCALSNLILLCVCLQLAGCKPDEPISAKYPQRPLKLIVPFGAGGGSDTFARILAKAIEDNQLLPEPIVIINVPGAGGAIGSRRLKNARPDGYTFMQLHEGILTSKYSGRVSYGPEAFEVVAGMGLSTMVIAVGENSRFQNLTELMNAATETPDEVIFAANIGAPSQFAGLMLEKVTPGAQFRYSQTGDGAKRFAGLQGGHTDVSAFSLAEYIQFKPSGLRAIALLGPKRHPEAQEVPTALEQGYDVLSTNMQFWWAPKGTPNEKLNVVAKALSEAMQTPEVQQRLAQLKIDPVTIQGEELSAELDDRSQRAAAVAQRPTVELPNFPAWIFAVAVLLAIVSFVPKSQIAKAEISPSSSASKTLLVLTALGMTFIYVAMMQFEILGYLSATLIYLLAMGYIFTIGNRKLFTTMSLLSVGLSIGLFYLFTEVFVIDLP